MSNSLHFSAAASVKNLFGRGLVTDQIAAIFELVKNSYDADAKSVHIRFENLQSDSPKITITDDGTGMNLEEIKDRWMVIGTDSKKDKMFSPIFKRPLNGDKGIGRFSVDRLGSFLHLTTQKQGTNKQIEMNFDWNLFDEKMQNISEIEIYYEETWKLEEQSGVTLEIHNLRDIWNLEKVKSLFSGLRQFKSPFSQEDNFKIYLSAVDFGYDHREVEIEKIEDVSSLWISAEIRPNNDDIVYLNVNKDGVDYESTIKNPYKFGTVKTIVYFFNQGDKIRFRNRYNLRVREFGNIRLYRDDFRIHPYGEERNDWLDLDRRQTQGFMRTFGSRDLVGYVQISKENNRDLKPLTNRQGLEENDDFEQLRNFVIQVCIKTLESFHFVKFKKNIDETIVNSKNQINNAVSGMNTIASEIRSDNPAASKKISEYVRILKTQQKNQLDFALEQQELVKVYSRIAQKETFLHKLIHQSMIHLIDASTILNTIIFDIDAPKEVLVDSDQLMGVKESITLANALLKTVRDDVVKKRNKSPVDIFDFVQRYFLSNKAIFDEDGISVEVQGNKGTQYLIDTGDLTAIINNLSTNSKKSLRKVENRDRKIHVDVMRNEKFIFLKFTDNGIGIKDEEREKIFNPFYSTTDGFGLGLTIIDEIVKEYGGTFELIETELGACFQIKMRFSK